MISIIAAIAKNGIIGSGNQMPWHISEDLKRFKAITSGHPVIMGRKTFESLGRPLPNRRNIVITRNPDYDKAGIETAASIDEALALFEENEEIFIIGGGEIYRQTLPLADRMYLTWIDAEADGDTYFPPIDSEEWEIVFSERHEQGLTFPHPFEFMNYKRKRHNTL